MDFMKLEEHSKLNPNGTGIGLSICKHIVEKMNGDIRVESEKNIGTSFKVLLNTKIKLNKTLIQNSKSILKTSKDMDGLLIKIEENSNSS